MGLVSLFLQRDRLLVNLCGHFYIIQTLFDMIKHWNDINMWQVLAFRFKSTQLGTGHLIVLPKALVWLWIRWHLATGVTLHKMMSPYLCGLPCCWSHLWSIKSSFVSLWKYWLLNKCDTFTNISQKSLL